MQVGSFKVAFWLKGSVHAVLARLAQEARMEPTAYMQRILTKHAAESDLMPERERREIDLSESLIERAIQRAREIDEGGGFSEDFVLTVFDSLVSDRDWRKDYEEAIGGEASESGLPGKSPLNMYLGWYIKNAIAAEPIYGSDRKPRRRQVKEKPIQSYTLLQRPGAETSKVSG
jgi:hypothetical protein